MASPATGIGESGGGGDGRNNNNESTRSLIDTDSDEAIARLLEREDSSAWNALTTAGMGGGSGGGGGGGGGGRSLPRPTSTTTMTAPHSASHTTTIVAGRPLETSSGPPRRTSRDGGRSGSSRNNNNNNGGRPTMAAAPPPPPLAAPHMCYAPCIIGDPGVCVELLVDTGASVSVMSIELAIQLGLQHQIDASVQGLASGIGHAQILGKLYNVYVELGHVEFRMDFAILGGTPDKLLLLGLDLMRQYKCIVDLESDVLIFGGRDGVQVPLLPADEQRVRSIRHLTNGGGGLGTESCAISIVSPAKSL